MNIRQKLLILIGIPFMGFISLSFVIIIKLTSNILSQQLNSQLVDQEDALVRQVSEQVYTSAKSYLAAVGDISTKNISGIYTEFKNGKISENELIDIAGRNLLDAQFVGSGYIYTVDEKGKILSHPDSTKIGGDSTVKDWLISQNKNVNAYTEYEYNGRNKILYKVYNPLFKWNLMISAYVDDFSSILDLKELNKTMNNIKIGRRGYPILLAEDGTIVSHPSPKLIGTPGTVIMDFDGNQILKRVRDEKNGHFNYKWQEDDGRIEDKFIYFKYDTNSKLIVCSTGYIKDFFFVLENIIRIVILSGTITGITLIIVLYLIATSVSKPISSFTHNLKDISQGEGDLTKRINITTSGEIGLMVLSFNKFLDTLQELITKIKMASVQTINIKDEVTTGVDETAASLHEISTNIIEIKKLTNHLNENVNKSTKATDDILVSADDLDDSVEKQSIMLETSTAAITEMISSIDNVNNITTSKKQSVLTLLESAKTGSTDISDTQNAVKEVSNQLTNIEEMATVISNIASQTNLLAMNAAIEAAHAGDAGKGFAVVADEIRKLAENSSSNSLKITQVLKSISQSIISADNLSEKTLESFTILNDEISDMADALTEISSSTNELQIGGKDILESITGLEEASHTVRERATKIKKLSMDVKSSMEDTKNVTMEVVTSIDEINQGVIGINHSMQVVTDNTYKLKETSDELKNNVDRFIV